MSLGSSVPPRAYTREILTTAFNWLQSQPDSVRSKATTPDALVGLYMQAQRGGAMATAFDTEAPVSSQTFMSDLKNLAEGLKEFDDSRANRAVNPPPTSRAQLGQAQTYPQQELRPIESRQAAPINPAPQPPAGATYAPQAPAFAQPAPAPQSFGYEPTVSAQTLTSELNDRSLQMLREVQLALNLTSEAEAMNMMIALAHKSLKSLLA